MSDDTASKKKLLVIVGAGSSIARGMPSVSVLDACMKSWAQEWAAARNWPDYFGTLWKNIEAYYCSGDFRVHPSLTFEKVLGEMVALSHWMTPAPWGDTLKQTISKGLAPPDPTFPYPEKYGPTMVVMDQLSHLLGSLARHMRSLCRRLDSLDHGAKQYGVLMAGLRDAFDVGVYNLNYDTAMLTAWPEAYTGFSKEGVFEPKVVHERSKWGFIYHLHGSVHHSLTRQFGGDICWRGDLSSEDKFFNDDEARSSDKRSEGRSFPRTTLIVGGFKLDQLLVEPFHSFHSALVRHIYAADAILIGGYGFADVHINRALRNRLATSSQKVPVMVLDRATDNTDPMAFREELWAYELCTTLAAARTLFCEPGHSSPPIPSELVASNSFEVACLHRVALWHGGFVQATRRIDGIVSWLHGGPDEVLLPSA